MILKKIINEDSEDVKNPTKTLSYVYPLSLLVASYTHTAEGDKQYLNIPKYINYVHM
jgi:hypothetical protein